MDRNELLRQIEPLIFGINSESVQNYLANLDYQNFTYFASLVTQKISSSKNNSPSKENLNINKFLLTIFQGLSYSSWWEKADQLKQNGLYVGYHNKLLLPSDFNEKDYQDSLKFTKPVILEIDEFIKHIDQMSAEELDELRKLFEESDFKSLINEAIFRID